MVEIAERLNVLMGTIESLAAPVVPEMITPVADVPAEFVPRMVTPLVAAFEFPRIILCSLPGAVLVLEIVVGWLVVAVSLALDSLVSLLELVLEIPGSAVIVDPELTKLAVLEPVVELAPPTMPVVELGAAAVLEPAVL